MLFRQVLAGGQVVEQAGARLPLARPGLATAGELEVVEQELAQLLGRAQVELVAGQVVDLRLQPDHALGERGGEAGEDTAVDLDAGLLHVGQDVHHGPLQRLVDRRHPLGGKAGLQDHP